MNGAHRELRTRLADGLRGDDAHRGTDVHRTPRGEVPTVALLAHAVLALAGEQRTQSDLLEAGGHETLEVVTTLDVATGGDEHLTVGRHDVVEHATADEVKVDPALAGLDEVVGHELVGTAVLFANDDILGDVDQAAREVTGVGCVRRRVDQALASAVRGDEVLQGLEALAEVRLDG